ncbi:MAG: Maf family protein [Bacteroidetes bacterium]|nr:Maf family protein [Bacteroidota bacterium]
MPRPQLILASKSKRRIKLIPLFGFKYKIHPSNISEAILENETPTNHVARLSCEKVLSISKNYKNQNCIILGADTIVVLNKKIITKPTSKKDAIKILAILSEKKHSVFTGITLLNCKNKKLLTDVVKTKVKFRKLEKKEIIKYVATNSPMDKAGAYGIQDDYGAFFVESIQGCYYNVVGLPLQKIEQAIKEILK